MTRHTRHTLAQGRAIALTALSLALAPALAQPAAAAEALTPLPASAYAVRAVCPPASPGRAACMALQLLPLTAAAREHTHPIGTVRAASAGPDPAPSPAAGDLGLRPQDVHAAYALPADAESPSTIALVDAYNDPNAESDLESYDTEFGLPKCTRANGCFEQLNQNGEAGNLPFPQNAASMIAEEAVCESGDEEACVNVEEAEGWSVEISLDMETAHAVCQNCRVALVEADEPSLEDLQSAVAAAERADAGEISNSWGSPECAQGSEAQCVGESSTFNDPGVVITAAAGDDGYLGWLEEPRSAFASFPASLPQVIAVGGTRLNPLSGGKWSGETVWNDGGKAGGRGGCSVHFAAQTWQRDVSDWPSVGCGSYRAVADVAADADPYSGLAVYDTSPECESEYKEGGTWHVLHDWCTIGGTSLASPLIASVFALAGGAHGVRYPAQTLYQNAVDSPASLHDVTVGSNGECDEPFDEVTFATACTQEAEAKASCADTLICQAGAGYDGPTGLGTPDGLAAFELPAGGVGEEGAGEGAGHGSGAGSTAPVASGSSGPATTTGSGASPGTGASTTAAALPVQLRGLSLTLKALMALDAGRPKIPEISFRFTSNVAARVRATLEKRYGRRARQRWRALTHPLTLAAVGGRNNGRLSQRGALGSGSYRLTLTPVGGAPVSITFKIG